MSWSELADKTGVPQGTISVWAGGTYKGNNERVATEISRYFDAYAVQLEMIAEAPRAPGYQPTPSSRRIINMLSWEQNGKLIDRTSVVQGKRVSVSVELGGGQIIKKTKKQKHHARFYRHT